MGESYHVTYLVEKSEDQRIKIEKIEHHDPVIERKFGKL